MAQTAEATIARAMNDDFNICVYSRFPDRVTVRIVIG